MFGKLFAKIGLQGEEINELKRHEIPKPNS